MTLREFDKLASEYGLQAYDRIELTTTTSFGYPLRGIFRARIQSSDEYWFASDGRAVWVTTECFDHMIDIGDIESLTVCC